jgi:hypothetical protein
MTSLRSTPLEPSPTPPLHSHRSFLSTPLSLSMPLSPLSTSPLLDPSPPLPRPLFLDLSLPRPQPRMSQPCSDSSESILPHPSPLTVSAPLNKPLKRLLFRTPLPKGEGVKQALAWNREQLLDLRRRWELRRQQRLSAGLLPMTQLPTMISDSVLDVEHNVNTVTGTPLSSQIHPSTSPHPNLELQCQDPFRPTAWQGLTSIVRKPQRWQLTSSMPLKTTKIPIRFRQHTTTAKKSRVSSPRDSDSIESSLPKGWVYEAVEVTVGVKAEVVDLDKYQMLDAPLTRHKRRLLEIDDAQLQDPYRQHRRASNTTEALPLSPSVSKTTAAKRRRGISGPISTLLTPL